MKNYWADIFTNDVRSAVGVAGTAVLVVADGTDLEGFHLPAQKNYSATTCPPPRSFFFRKKERKNMIKDPIARTMKVSM
jgi:hypothetical protein